MPHLLRRQAEAFGDSPYLTIGEVERTFSQARDVAARAAGTLREAGVERGGRVAFLCGNRHELYDFFIGCAWLGAIAVPLNTAVRGSQLQHMLDNSAPRVLIVDVELLGVLDEVQVPSSLVHIWAVGDPDRLPATTAATCPVPPLGEALEVVDVRPDETLAILYTSGTTGVSKGVCCPHAQFYWWGVLVGEALEITRADRLFTCLPLFHTNALTATVQALLAGAHCTIGRRFSASRFFDQAIAADATVAYLLGTMVSILCARPPDERERAHRLRVALAPGTPAQLFEQAHRRFGISLVEGYGSTELNLVIGTTIDAQRPGLMGRALPEFDVAVVDELDQPVPDGTAGELVVRPREPFSVATGYFAMDGATVMAWRNLWFHTGDRVVRDTDGWIRFIDRIKDAIRRRGENIASFEVEQVLLAHPAVKEVAAFPVPSELGEDDVMVAIVPAHDMSVDPVSLISHCEGQLAYFAIPRYVDFVPELPLTSNGKVRKAVLRERGITPTTWDREAAGCDLERRPLERNKPV